MPRLLLFAPCQLGIIDSATSVLSIINLIEAVNLGQLPGALPEISIVSIWRRYDEELDASMVQKVVLLDSDRQVLISIETPFLFERMGHRIINRIGSLPITRAGAHEFQLFVKRQGSDYPSAPSASYPLLVQQVPQVRT